jgi:hypothetical protein
MERETDRLHSGAKAVIFASATFTWAGSGMMIANFVLN